MATVLPPTKFILEKPYNRLLLQLWEFLHPLLATTGNCTFMLPTFPQIYTDIIIIIMKQIFKYYDIYNMWFKISSGLQ